MKYSLIAVASFIYGICYSQSLSQERISKIKNATVRITIDSTSSVGTGFFVANDGTIVTCWHVVKPAIVSLNNIHKVFVELNSGEKLEALIFGPSDSFVKACIIYDFAVLYLKNKPIENISFLNIGNYSDLAEGESVYTCGYPLGIKQQFVSVGIESTKYIDTITYSINGIAKDKKLREQSLCDLTLNEGNSGGAIVKLGNTPNEDKVVGIADFIIIPYAQTLRGLTDTIKERLKYGDIGINGIPAMATSQLFSDALSQASNGISGCVSIDYFLQALQAWKRTDKK
jgi:serine protease Do